MEQRGSIILESLHNEEEKSLLSIFKFKSLQSPTPLPMSLLLLFSQEKSLTISDLYCRVRWLCCCGRAWAPPWNTSGVAWWGCLPCGYQIMVMHALNLSKTLPKIHTQCLSHPLSLLFSQEKVWPFQTCILFADKFGGCVSMEEHRLHPKMWAELPGREAGNVWKEKVVDLPMFHKPQMA